MTSVKRFFSMMVLLMAAEGTVMAQVTPPALINYQGVLRDKTTGQPLNAMVNLVFTFYPDPNSAGTDILSDSQTGVVVSNGLFSLQLGGGVLSDGAGPGTYASLSVVFRDFSEVWLEVRVGSETLSPRVRVAGAAYAMNTSRLEGKKASEFLDTSVSFQSKSGELAVNGIDALEWLSVYGPTYAGSSLLVDGPTFLYGPLTTNSPITANGGLALPGGTALQFPDGTATVAGRTPQQIATLHWYGAAEPSAIPVGDSPLGVAFDGSSIWVTNYFGNNVTKLRASDGASLGSFGVYPNPRGVAFDGSSIWVAISCCDIVTKLRASDGSFLGDFIVGSNPEAVAFDGSSIWVANFSSNSMTKLRASDGANLGTFPVGLNPTAVAFDGSAIWVANSASGTVTKLRASNGANLGTVPVGTSPRGVAFDGSNIWVTNFGNNNVTKLRASDGANLGTFPVGSDPTGVAFDGSSIWVTNTSSNNVTKLRASDGANLGIFPVASNPAGVAFDGSSIWVANFSSNSMSKL